MRLRVVSTSSWYSAHSGFQGLGIRARLDVEDGADVVARGQHKFLVQRPLGLVVQARGRVQVHHLVVLHRQVVPRALQVRHLQRKCTEFTGPQM